MLFNQINELEQGNMSTSVNQNGELAEQLQANNSSHAQRMMDESANCERRSYLVIIVVLVALHVVSMAVYLRRAWNMRLHRLQQMEGSFRKRPIKKRALEQGNVGVKEGAETVGHWNPEGFDEMLENAEAVQEVIVDGIIGEMETEGREKAKEKQEMHVLDPVDASDDLTPF